MRDFPSEEPTSCLEWKFLASNEDDFDGTFYKVSYFSTKLFPEILSFYNLVSIQKPF